MELYAAVRRRVYVEGWSERAAARRVGLARETVRKMLRDRQAVLPLPPVPYDACDQRSTRVTSLSLVRYRRNDYSVPTAYGHRAVVVKGYVDEVVIVCGSEEIARQRRSCDRAVWIFDPRHDVALLERKTGALDQAAPLVGWALPEEFLRLRRLLEARLGKPGTREYVQVLRLLEDFRLAQRPRRRPGRPHPGRDRLRRRQASDAVPHRTPATPARSGAVSASAGRPRGDDRGGGLPGAAGGGHRVLATSTLLLDAHLKALRLPDLLARVRPSGAAMRPRRAGLSALPVPTLRASAARPRAASRPPRFRS